MSDLYSRTAELTSKKRIDAKTTNVHPRQYLRYIQPSSSHCLKNRHLFKLLFINVIIFMCGKILKTLGFYLSFRNGCVAGA